MWCDCRDYWAISSAEALDDFAAKQVVQGQAERLRENAARIRVLQSRKVEVDAPFDAFAKLEKRNLEACDPRSIPAGKAGPFPLRGAQGSSCQGHGSPRPEARVQSRRHRMD